MEPERIASYTLKHEIGMGGMSKVYFAVNSINDPFAVKILNIDLAQHESIRRRFRNEMEALKSLRDIEQVCQIKDYYEDNKQMAIVMEYLTGVNLLSYIKRNGAASPELLIDWLRQLLPPFAICHTRKIVHRDVKPSNFLLTNEGKIKILDFGIAKALNQSDEQLNSMSLGLTSIQEVLGSPMYMSPEQVRGLQEIDHRSDIYSLGVMMYTLLIGNNPYEGLSTRSYFDIQESIVKKPLPPLSGNAAIFNPVIQKSTQKEPIDRHQSIQELLDEVNALAIKLTNRPKPTVIDEQPTIAIIKPEIPISAVTSPQTEKQPPRVSPSPVDKSVSHRITPEQRPQPVVAVAKPAQPQPKPETHSARVSTPKQQPAPQVAKPLQTAASTVSQPKPSPIGRWLLIGLGIILPLAVIAVIFIDKNDSPKEKRADSSEQTSSSENLPSGNAASLPKITPLMRASRLLSRIDEIPQASQSAVFASAQRTFSELKSVPGNAIALDSLFGVYKANAAQSALIYYKTGSVSARQTAVDWYQTAYTIKAEASLLQEIQSLNTPKKQAAPPRPKSTKKPKPAGSRSVEFIEF